MPKKIRKNGFYYFMVDFKEREEKKGIYFWSLADVQANPQCSKEWQELSAEEKNRYIMKAKQEKICIKEKQTGLGESIKLLEKQEDEIQKYEANMKEFINSTIQNANDSGELHLLLFYFIHVNWYYTRIDEKNVVEYYPAEFSVIEFSLGDGVKRCFYDIIKCQVRMGYSRDAMMHSQKTHKIKFYDEDIETDYKELYKNFCNFITCGDNSMKKFPPFYTTNDMKIVVPCLFDRMTEAAGVSKNQFDLYSIEYLFGTLMFELNENLPKSFNRASLAEAELGKDTFIWAPDIECLYHRQIKDSGPYCSKSIVTRWGYTLCDFCCPLLNIKMISGKHYPFYRNDLLVDSMNSLTTKEEIIDEMLSETGVSQAYRLKVSERTREENERRKKQGGTLTIIDHGKIMEEKYSMTASSAASPKESSSVSDSQKKQRSSRLSIPLSEVVAGPSNHQTLNLDNDNFPVISPRKSRLRTKK